MKEFSLADRFSHTALTGAYRLMRVYWWIRRPRAHGALVAIWHDDKILLIRNSYHNYLSLPGGYVHPNESGADAAVRELEEELGLSVGINSLNPAVEMEQDWEYKSEHVEIFTLQCVEAPKIKLDGREVISADYFEPEEALGLEMYPPIRVHIEEVLKGK